MSYRFTPGETEALEYVDSAARALGLYWPEELYPQIIETAVKFGRIAVSAQDLLDDGVSEDSTLSPEEISRLSEASLHIAVLLMRKMPYMKFAKLYNQQSKQTAGNNAAERESSLSPRQKEVVELMLSGLSYAEIGQRLGVNPGTINSHKFFLSKKLGIERGNGFVLGLLVRGELPAYEGDSLNIEEIDLEDLSQEVLLLVAEGSTYQEIADKLKLTSASQAGIQARELRAVFKAPNNDVLIYKALSANVIELLPEDQRTDDKRVQISAEFKALQASRDPVEAQVESSNPWGLTKKEEEVFKLLAEGLRNAEIAGKLGVSENTIKARMTGIITKTGAPDRYEAALLAYQFYGDEAYPDIKVDTTLLAKLTGREREALRAIQPGASSNQDIATALSVGPATAKYHVKSICDKMGIDNRQILVIMSYIASRDNLFEKVSDLSQAELVRLAAQMVLEKEQRKAARREEKHRQKNEKSGDQENTLEPNLTSAQLGWLSKVFDEEQLERIKGLTFDERMKLITILCEHYQRLKITRASKGVRSAHLVSLMTSKTYTAVAAEYGLNQRTLYAGLITMAGSIRSRTEDGLRERFIDRASGLITDEEDAEPSAPTDSEPEKPPKQPIQKKVASVNNHQASSRNKPERPSRVEGEKRTIFSTPLPEVEMVGSRSNSRMGVEAALANEFKDNLRILMTRLHRAGAFKADPQELRIPMANRVVLDRMLKEGYVDETRAEAGQLNLFEAVRALLIVTSAGKKILLGSQPTRAAAESIIDEEVNMWLRMASSSSQKA